MSKDSGFTIVEIVVAVLIIGIVIAIGIPNYLRQSEIARSAKATKALMVLRSAQLAYFSNFETFFNDPAVINETAGGNLFDPGNPDWNFTITTANDTQLQLTAIRLRGPHQAAGNTTITLTDDPAANVSQQWGGTYPKDDPGNF